MFNSSSSNYDSCLAMVDAIQDPLSCPQQPTRHKPTIKIDSMAVPIGNTSIVHTAVPRYGARLLPQVVDQLAVSDPIRVYASIPISSDLSAGFRDVSMLDMAAAIDSFAWWLETNIGRSSQFETLSYMGVSDVRYAIVFLAAVKCGYKVNARLPSHSRQVPALTLLASTDLGAKLNLDECISARAD